MACPIRDQSDLSFGNVYEEYLISTQCNLQYLGIASILVDNSIRDRSDRCFPPKGSIPDRIYQGYEQNYHELMLVG